MDTRQLSGSAFTLVELLVVITIIVVLLALITPAMDKAVDKAVRLSCMTRMRTANQAMTIYAMENKRTLHPWLDTGGGYPWFWWHRLHKNSYLRDREMDAKPFPSGPMYYQSPFACPEQATKQETHPRTGQVLNTEGLPEWIAYNIFLGWSNANPGGDYAQYARVRQDKVQQPNKTFMFTDGHRISRNHPYTSEQLGAFARGDYILSFSEPDVGSANMTKHGDGANYMFVDGHGEELTREEAQYRSNNGRTGWSYRREHFFLPFPSY